MRQLLPLGAHHVVVLLEGVFQPQKLGRGKGGSDPLRLSGQRVVQKEALWACVIPLEAVAQISVAVDEPGVEGGRVPLLRGEEGVWRVRGGQGVGGQGVRRRHRVHWHGGVGRVRDRLSEHQVRVGVDAPAGGGGGGGRVEAVEERVYGAGVGVAERRGTDGVLGARGGQGTVLGHQRLDGEAALGRRLEHAVPRSGRPGLPAPGDRGALPPPPAVRCPRQGRTGIGDLFVGGGGGGRKGRKKGKERKKERRGEGEGERTPWIPRILHQTRPTWREEEKSFQKNLQAWIGVIFFGGGARWRGGIGVRGARGGGVSRGRQKKKFSLLCKRRAGRPKSKDNPWKCSLLHKLCKRFVSS